MVIHHVAHADAAQERDLLHLALPTEEEVQWRQDEKANEAYADANGEAQVDELQHHDLSSRKLPKVFQRSFILDLCLRLCYRKLRISGN